jgi:hypothetical protein
MGFKFSWKIAWKYLWKIIALISAIIGIVIGWHIVLDILNWIKNMIFGILKFSVSTTGRDVILFVLVVGILFWLFLINRKIRSFPPQTEESEEKEKKEKWEFDWDKKHDYILEKFIEADGEMIIRALFEGYKEKFPEDSEEEYKLIVYDLEEAELIRHSANVRGGRLYVLAKEGRRQYMKRMREKVARKKEKIKLSEKHIQVLAHIAEFSVSVGLTDLFRFFKDKFQDFLMSDMKAIINDLERMGYIHRAGSEGGEFFYKTTEEGIKIAKRILDKARNWKKSSKD